MNRMWYALPLIVSVSLVYSATRHEQVKDIVQHAMRTAIWIFGFMLAVFGVLFIFTYYAT
ncbi:MAG: hypothetical protein K8T91_19950 [Planctomycetes bacterium]|nr:hypothetical protein [Planctomycetota bacterium]